MNFCRLTIQEPIFSVSNTEFEGGDDGHGLGDCTYTFLVKQAQPSRKHPDTRIKPLPLTNGHGCYMTIASERTLLSVGGWPLHITVINF
jgi:hypothetical protein